MSSKQQLIDEIVAFRLGRWTEPHSVADFTDVLDYVTRDSSVSTLAIYNASQRRLYSVNGYEERLIREDDVWSIATLKYGSDLRVANFCSYLDSINVTGKFLMNFTDAPFWGFNEKFKEFQYPIFQFSRHFQDDSAILFPLDHKYMGPGSANLPLSLENVDIPYDQKIDKAVWRGRLSGVVRDEHRHFHVEKICGALTSASAEEAERIIHENSNFQRVALCLKFRDHIDFDIGITGPEPFWYKTIDEYPGAPILKKLSAPWLKVSDQLKYRYLVSLPGNDYSSGIYWALMSNSVVLSPPLNWRTALDFGLKEWEHFVPISNDLADMPEKIDWCRSHDREVRDIIARAKSYCKLVTDIEIRDKADETVASLYEKIVRRSSDGRRKALSYSTDSFLSEMRKVKQL